jgi:hypothetical protein
MTTNVLLALLVAAIGMAPCGTIAQGSAAPTVPADPCESASPPSPSAGPNRCLMNGVIKPPDTGDRAVVRPPDSTQSMPMPVIPPPGTPGNDQNVQPK